MRGQVELGDHTSNDAVVEFLSSGVRKLFESFPEALCPLAHDVIGGNDLGSRVMRGTAHDNIINICIAEIGS